MPSLNEQFICYNTLKLQMYEISRRVPRCHCSRSVVVTAVIEKRRAELYRSLVHGGKMWVDKDTLIVFSTPKVYQSLFEKYTTFI